MPEQKRSHAAAKSWKPSQDRQLVVQPRRPRLYRFVSQAGVAVLLLAALGLGYVAFRMDSFERDGRTIWSAAPAAVTPAPEETPGETILEVALSAEVLKASPGGSTLAHLSVPPDSTATWSVPQAVVLHTVLRGALAVRLDTQGQVLRAGISTWRTIPGGSEVVLTPGDSVVLRDTISARYRNNGETAVDTVTWLLTAAGAVGNPVPGRWEVHDVEQSVIAAMDRTEPALLRLRRITLAPESVIPAPAVDTYRLLVGVPFNEDGSPVARTLVKGARGPVSNYGSEPQTVYAATLEFAPSGDPTQS